MRRRCSRPANVWHSEWYFDGLFERRIVILRAVLFNMLPINELEPPGEGCCTYCCTPVEVSVQLARLIAAWPSLKDEQRRGLGMLLTAGTADYTAPPKSRGAIGCGKVISATKSENDLAQVDFTPEF